MLLSFFHGLSPSAEAQICSQLLTDSLPFLISDTFQIFNPAQHRYGDGPNIAHRSGHGFNGYVATAEGTGLES